MLGVGTGAFGAHALRMQISPDMLEVWQTAVLYQLVHALGVLAIAGLSTKLHQNLATAAAAFLLAGIVIFSGSLYLLVLSDLRVVGAITPVGGVSFMIGWLLLALAALRAGSKEDVA